LLERVINTISYIPIVGPGKTVEPNLVLSDFAVRKMLEHIRQNDTDHILLPQSPSDVLAAIGFRDCVESSGQRQLGEGLPGQWRRLQQLVGLRPVRQSAWEPGGSHFWLAGRIEGDC